MTNSRWLRLYVEVYRDPKVSRLSDRMFRFWIGCLCLAAENEGIIPMHTDVAYLLRLPETKVLENLIELKQRGLLDEAPEKRFTPHNWSGRQYQSDSSVERTRRYRDKTRMNGLIVGAYEKHRAAIFERDGSACAYCGSTKNLCIDHMIPISKGGDDDPSNLCVACKFCNSGKAGKTPEEAGLKFRLSVTEEFYRHAKVRILSRSVTLRDGHSDGIEQRQIQKQNRTETEQSGGCLRAAEFAAAFPDQSNQNATVREYLSLVSASEEEAVFACLERYTRSVQVSDGKVQTGWKWLRAQKENGWNGNWPEVKIAANGIDRKVAAYLKRKHEEDEENAS